MNCKQARSLVWPPERPRIADAEVLAARTHIETCSACRAHFAIDDLLKDAREGLTNAVTPREVRERVFDAVARGRTGTPPARPRHRRRSAAIAGGLMLAAAGVLLVRPFAETRSTADNDAAFVEDYMRLAVREDHIVTSDSAEVRLFLLRELGTSVAPLNAPGFRIAGAEVCLLEGRRGALIRYDTERGIVSYYLLPTAGAEDRAPRVGTAPVGGASLITWVRGDVERALVGPVPAETLLQVARASL